MNKELLPRSVGSTQKQKRRRKTDAEILKEIGPETRLLSRQQIAVKQGVSVETVKRRERQGLLQPIRFNSRLVRYRLSDVLAYEAAAAGGPK
jgi:predicted DNA-binding transcriptional regulator AlpA